MGGVVSGVLGDLRSIGSHTLPPLPLLPESQTGEVKKDSFIEHLLQATHLRSGAPRHPQGDPGLGSLYVDLGPTS